MISEVTCLAEATRDGDNLFKTEDGNLGPGLNIGPKQEDKIS